jgi:tryptophan synthase alpha chain
MAAGPVVQRASERALAQGVGLKDVLATVAAFRRTDTVTPIVLMGYANPIEAMGTMAFADRGRDAGVDGVLVVDYPPEEAGEFAALLGARGLAPIFLVAPTSTETRMRLIAEHSSGFVYVLARAGVTGVREHLSSELRDLVGSVRRHTRLPIAVGFGISRREHVSEVWEYADAAVVGSRMVLEIERHLNSANLVTEVSRLARELIGGL